MLVQKQKLFEIPFVTLNPHYEKIILTLVSSVNQLFILSGNYQTGI